MTLISSAKTNLFFYGGNCISVTSSTREEFTQFKKAAVNSFHPGLKYTWEISDISLAFLTSKFQLKAALYALVFTTKSWIHIVNCIHLRIHHTSRIPYLLRSFLDIFIDVVTTLIFPKNQRQYVSFSINVAILTLSFKRATTVPNKLTDSQHYKRLRRKTLIAFYSLSHSPSQPRS